MTRDDSPYAAAAPVLVPTPAERPYTYAVPSGMRVVPGSIVRVPLGPRQVAGIVWDGPAGDVDPRKLRPIDTFEVAARPWFEQARHFDRINQALYLDMQLLLSGNNLVKPDRMGMAVSIEARTPFLDWRMMEFAFRAPGRTKLSADGDKKHWYKRAVTPLIGEDLAYRRKQMFTVPVGEWFRRESYPWLQGVLAGSALVQELCEPAEIERLLVQHRDGSANHTRELRALAALALWDAQR